MWTEETINNDKANMVHFKISFRDQVGNEYVKWFDIEGAQARLNYLDAAEVRTLECAPTDSGNTRFTYCREAALLREHLTQLSRLGYCPLPPEAPKAAAYFR